MAGPSLASRERLEPNGVYRLPLCCQMFAQELEMPLLRRPHRRTADGVLSVQHHLMGEVFAFEDFFD